MSHVHKKSPYLDVVLFFFILFDALCLSSSPSLSLSFPSVLVTESHWLLFATSTLFKPLSWLGQFLPSSTLLSSQSSSLVSVFHWRKLGSFGLRFVKIYMIFVAKRLVIQSFPEPFICSPCRVKCSLFVLIFTISAQLKLFILQFPVESNHLLVHTWWYYIKPVRGLHNYHILCASFVSNKLWDKAKPFVCLIFPTILRTAT